MAQLGRGSLARVKCSNQEVGSCLRTLLIGYSPSMSLWLMANMDTDLVRGRAMDGTLRLIG